MQILFQVSNKATKLFDRQKRFLEAIVCEDKNSLRRLADTKSIYTFGVMPKGADKGLHAQQYWCLLNKVGVCWME